MSFISRFLKRENPTIETDKKQHIYRSTEATDALVTETVIPKLKDRENTVVSVWDLMAQEYKDTDAFGYRKLVNVHKNEKNWNMYELEDYTWITYGQAKVITTKMAIWLQRQGLKSGDRLMIYAKTKPEWMQMAITCFSLGVVICTAYDSMAPDAIAHIIKETEPSAVLTETTLLRSLKKTLKLVDKNICPKLIIHTGEDFEDKGAREEFCSEFSHLEQWTSILESIDDEESIQGDPSPKQDDLALIMYTSGTTGAPKGIELTHGNIISATGAAQHLALDLLRAQPHCYIGFLPLAHVLEFILEFILISSGVPIGYATVRTLMGESVCGKDGQGKGIGDIELLQPTIMAGVPAIWERVRNGVFKTLDKQHWTVRKAFEAAIEAKWQLLNLFGRENTITRVFDATVFRPVRQKLGGKLVYGVTGGAPLSADTHKFVMTAMCDYLLQGYGLTECCGLGAITVPSMGPVLGAIGAPSPSIEFRLVDVPETDYKAENRIGELWVRGPSLMRGYYKRPDLNKEAMTEDGWFKTGDVAQLHDNGVFGITDRVKNLVKLSNGEYIALESLESKYRDCQEIKNICVIAESDKSYIIAVVEPSDASADKDELLKTLQNVAKKRDCNKAEIIQDILITKDKDWQSEFLTTSGKLSRRDIYEAYKDDIKDMYKSK